VDSDCDGHEDTDACAYDTIDRADDGTGPALLLSASGDLDGDGVDDLVLASSVGTLRAYAGPWAAGDLDDSTWSWETSGTPAALDVVDADGDGVSALLVGVPDAGAVYLLSDMSADDPDHPAWWVDGDGQAIGTAVTAGADVDADTNADILIGCATCAPDSTEQGVVSIQTLGSSGSALFDGDVATFTGEDGERLGESAVVVDLDADGFPEVVLSSQTEGLRLWLGPVVGTLDSSSSDDEYRVGMEGADYALSLATAPDLDGDGRPGLVVGEPVYEASSTLGRARFYDGSSTGYLTEIWDLIGTSEEVGLGAWARVVRDRVAVGCTETGAALFAPSGYDYLDDALAALSVEDPDATLSGPPAVGDFDADGDEDLILLESSPTANRARLWTDW
jgi:hypothetical protein